MKQKWPVRVGARTGRDTTKGSQPMVAPHNRKENAGRVPVQTKTMFYNEGNPAAILVVNRRGRRKRSTMDFPSSEAAFRWCRENGVNLIYTPVNITHG